jgi:16S rRNA (guanine527-N7)-methyltransferase
MGDDFSESETDLIRTIFPELTGEKIGILTKYAALLRDWNGKINLISRKDMANVVEKHLIPSLASLKVATFATGENVLDIGTGGGLPGIPLAIARHATKFTLIDSIGKKIMAVEDMVVKLGLKNVQTFVGRAEKFSGKFDKITGRAVTDLKEFLKYAKKLLVPAGEILYLKGGNCAEDLKLLKKYKLYNLAKLTGIDRLADKVILKIFQ